MDKGILETTPEDMKLEYCISINTMIQDEIEHEISKLIGEAVYIKSPKRGLFPEENSGGKNTIIVETKIPRKWSSEVVRFSLKELPGCCGVMVSYNTRVNNAYRGKGINSFLQGIKEKIAKNNGYSILMATTIDINLAEVHILEKFGWKCINKFLNSRTNNTVKIFTKNLEV